MPYPRAADRAAGRRELTSFLIHYWRPDTPAAASMEAGWDATLDAFFLRGQQAGVFCIDLAAPALTEILVGLMVRLIDAERHGRSDPQPHAGDSGA